MLTFLSIRNVAIIDRLELEFGPGLNLLTGETGAGKSIIIDALTLASGGRASADMIRSSEEEAVVEAVFDISSMPDLKTRLDGAGFEAGDELIVKRCLSKSGRNRVFINGSVATLAQLMETGQRLVTIHGQHESQALLRPEQHLQLLDSYAGTIELRREYSRCFSQVQELKGHLDSYESRERETARRMEILRFQLEELAGSAVVEGEDESLEEQRRLLANAERLAGATSAAFELLYGGDSAMLGELRRVSTSLADAARIDPSLSDLAATVDGAFLQLEDAALQLRDYSARIDSDPETLRQIEDRVDLLGRLKRKYAPTISGILEMQEAMTAELSELEAICCSKEQLEKDMAVARVALADIGARLTLARREAAIRLSAVLSEEARQLAMPHAEVEITFAELSEPRPGGNDRVEFLFSPNPGEPPRALARVASGGELSRLMLAFKQVLPDGEAPTLVFDEVDAGIGGAVAGVVGRKLRNLATGQQVFCITHLPQVAAWATQHLKVEKRVTNGRTSAVVTALDSESVIEELARMLAGETVSDGARGHAADLVAQAALL